MKNLLACIGLLAIAGLLFALAVSANPPRPESAKPATAQSVGWLDATGKPLAPRPVRYEHRP